VTGHEARIVVVTMDAKLRSLWNTKAMQAGFAPQAPVSVGAIAALPVLPSSFSSATAEPRRSGEGIRREAVSDGADAAATSGTHGSDGGVLKLGGPVHILGADVQAAVAVRVSDFAPAREKDAEPPSCRPGDTASLTPPAQAEGTADARAKEHDADGEDHPVPLPHCLIEFDPEAEDGEMVAGGTAPLPRQGGADGTKLAAVTKAQVPAQAPPAEKQPSGETAKPVQAPVEPAPAAETTPSQPAAAPPQAPAPAHDAPVVITEATRGVGASVIDPLMPTETITFGGDLSLLFPPAPEQAPPPASVPAVASGEDAGAVVPLPNPDWTLIG
jgi:hypothetical protein